ncbi:hypothetical protein H074_35784 [Amycolatopsis decaplanina DSM 44594]|uniref:Uncharacterized protein n=1 Tax=Amycolatopsis decaplanina DSM 44594 TaxID=1284240 RepID=M2XRA0_9PSEU|nr:hypothetical protein H074_35784 [Amycolatopsis decaplanina DSM 44594]
MRHIGCRVVSMTILDKRRKEPSAWLPPRHHDRLFRFERGSAGFSDYGEEAFTDTPAGFSERQPN